VADKKPLQSPGNLGKEKQKTNNKKHQRGKSIKYFIGGETAGGNKFTESLKKLLRGKDI